MGGYTNNTNQPTICETGYKGNLCSNCDIVDSQKYEQVGNFECLKCPDIVFNAIRVIGLCLLVFLFIMLLIIINVRKTKESEISVLLRIMTNYLQLLTTSMSFSTNYPDTLSDIFYPAQRVGGSSDTFLSFDCFVTDFQIKGPFESTALFKQFLLFFLPLILFIIVALLWVIVYLLKRKWVKDLKRNLVISFISIVFLLHPKLTEQSLSMFRCVEIDDGVSMMRMDTDIECYSSKHLLL